MIVVDTAIRNNHGEISRVISKVQGKHDPHGNSDTFRSVAGTTSGGVFRLSEAGHVIYVAPASLRLREQMPGQNTPCSYLGYIASEDHALAEQSFRLLLAGGHSLEVVLRLIGRNGALIQAQIHATPWYDGSRIIGVQGCIRTLSAQKRAAHTPERSNAQRQRRMWEPNSAVHQDVQVLERLLNSTTAGIGIICRGKIRYCNAQMARLVGYTVPELLNMRWTRLLAEEPDATDANEIRTSLESGEAPSVECRWQRKDGTFVDVLCHTVPLAGSDVSRSREVALTVLDITARKQMEQELQAAYNELDQILNVPVPLCLLSLECRIVKVNQAFCDFFSCDPEEVLGRTGQEVWGCTSCDSEKCSLKQLQSGPCVPSMEVDQVVQGRPLVCTIYAVPYVDATGRLSGLVITLRDGYPQKKISADLLKTQEQLIHAEKLSAIGSLTASIAHEFNNPLCGVRSVMERMARKSVLSGGDQKLVELALEQCDRMKRLVKNLQQFNLPFSDVKSEFDVHRVLDAVLLLLHKYLKIRKAAVRKEYAAGVLLVTGAQNQIEQVLLNLIKNSGEAMKECGGEIRIQTRQEAHAVHIVIADTGVGISKESLPHIFEPFFTTKSTVRESGLGLSVSCGIVKSHQGEIQVESTVGKGTTFTVILPLEGSVTKDEGRQ
jgi:PAS domain S-box-containing protein